MKKTWLFAVAVAWAASLFGAGLWAQTYERSVRVGADGQIVDIPTPAGQPAGRGSVISGEDFGFRLGSVQPGNRSVTGTVVVRLEGVWWEVSNPVTLQPAGRR